jgi:hypothetical protein
LEPFHSFGPLHNLQRPVAHGLDPLHQLASISSVGPM